MTNKDDVARRLAAMHYEFEPYITHIYRVVAPPNVESRDDEPVKLLEVSESTVASGILPLGFAPYPEGGIDVPTIIVEITPGEFERLCRDELKLPHGWVVANLITRPSGAVVA